MNFRLPDELGEPNLSRLLRRLQATRQISVEPGESAQQALIARIRSGAASAARLGVWVGGKKLLRVRVGGRTLLLPGACPVVPSRLSGETIRHPLTAMAVITQSTDNVWLSAREPRLGRLATVPEIALWIPPSVSPR